jgi:oligoendopeptidase F
MTTQTTDTPGTLPQRADIEEKYTWNLTDIYASDEAWEESYRKAQDITKKAPEFAGKLSESPQILYDCLKLHSELSLLLGNLYMYAYLNKDVDNRVSKYQAMTNRTSALAAESGAAFAFIEPELLQIDESRLLQMADQFPRTDEYDFYIRDLIRSKKHIRSHEVEELLANSSLIARGPGNIFSMLDDADLKYGTVRDEKGNEVALTKQRFAKFLESPDRRVRKEANDTFNQPYKDHINTTAASLSTAVNADLFFARARHYDSCLHAALDSENIPLSVYHSLLDTTEQNLDGLHAYVALRKKILKLDEIAPYDMYCPLFPQQHYEVPYEDAVGQVVEAVRPLGETYQTQMKKAFDTRWVDVFETQGKGSGAYSYGNYDIHPFVLMNYNDTVDNMFTLAHEMGHALHSHLSSEHQPYSKAHYSIFVAEVASTLNEGLLLDYLLERATDDGQKLYLLNRYLDNTVGTFFRQIHYARFELRIHEEVEKGGALSPDLMNSFWSEGTRQYFGPDLTPDEFDQYKWSRIPHFYRGYYVYQYATSYAASGAILKKFETGDPSIVEKYLELLSSGGKDYPVELLKICGVDMTTPEPVTATIGNFAAKLAEMEKLIG